MGEVEESVHGTLSHPQEEPLVLVGPCARRESDQTEQGQARHHGGISVSGTYLTPGDSDVLMRTLEEEEARRMREAFEHTMYVIEEQTRELTANLVDIAHRKASGE